MANTVKNSGTIAKAGAPQKQQPQSIKQWIQAYKKQFEKALPSAITPERFTRMALTALAQNPKLQSCTPSSFLGSLLNAAQLGLEPNTPLGQAYLIPFYNNKKKVLECQFQIGYKGFLDLAYRSGELQSLQAHVVFENDEFEFEYGLEPKLMHKPAMSDRGEARWVYAVFKLNNGGSGFEVMSMDDIRNHAEKFSKAYQSGPWQTNFDEMAKKTVIKKLLKYAPMKSEFVRGMISDDTVSRIELPASPNDDLVIQQEEYIVLDDDTAVDTSTGEVTELIPDATHAAEAMA